MRIYELYSQRNHHMDHTVAMIVRAKDSRAARKLAAAVSERDVWLNPKKSSCRALKLEGTEEAVILRDFSFL